MYTIKHAAERTGVSEATLRAWERRYSLVSPERTEGGYRVYSDEDLRRIREVVTLVDQGSTPGLAARHVREAAGDADRRRAVRPHPAELGGLPFAPPVVPETDHQSEATARLVAAATAIDPVALGEVLDEQLATGSFEHVVDGWLMPALAEIGRAWASGRMSVAGEHLVAHAVHRRMAAAFDAARTGGGASTVVVGLPAGVHHELGLFAFAVALRRAGVDVIHLGPDVPIAAWRAALDVHGARAAATAAPMGEDVAATRAVVRGLRRSHPSVELVVGGAHQDEVTGTRVLRPGHLIGAGAATVAERLARTAD